MVVVKGTVVSSVAVVEDSVVMPGVIIEPGAIVRHAILGENAKVCSNAVVGGVFPAGTKRQICVAAKGTVIDQKTVLLPGEMR